MRAPRMETVSGLKDRTHGDELGYRRGRGRRRRRRDGRGGIGETLSVLLGGPARAGDRVGSSSGVGMRGGHEGSRVIAERVSFATGRSKERGRLVDEGHRDGSRRADALAAGREPGHEGLIEVNVGGDDNAGFRSDPDVVGTGTSEVATEVDAAPRLGLDVGFGDGGLDGERAATYGHDMHDFGLLARETLVARLIGAIGACGAIEHVARVLREIVPKTKRAGRVDADSAHQVHD